MLDSTPEYVNTRDAARMIGLRPATLEGWRVRRTDAIPFVKAGRKVLYAVADLRSWMTANKRRSTSQSLAAA